jgi:HAD superfamily hydrolase (TIGR01450 family)
VQSFAELVRNYQVVFFDAYGVLKNSGGVLTGVTGMLEALIAEGKDLYVVTNDASKSPQAMADQFPNGSNGTDILDSARFISSGLMATDFLSAKVPPGKVAYLGKPTSAYYIEATGKHVPVPIADCGPSDDVEALVLLDDEGFDWQRDINLALNLLRRKNIPSIVANADPTYPVDGKNVAVAVGALGRLLEELVGKRFIHFGKPDAYMFSFALSKARKQRPTLNKREILMVGDTLQTDIAGGNKFGVDTVLVLSGNTAAKHAAMRIEASGIIPTFICESVLT